MNMKILAPFSSIQLLFFCLSCTTLVLSEYLDIFLNSPHDCGHNKTYGVNPHKGYYVKPDVTPNRRTTSFRNCEVTFHSERHDGRLCLSQEGKLSEFLDSNAQLSVYDGADDSDKKKRIFLLAYGPDKWTAREYCTNSPYLYFYLEKKDFSKLTDVRLLHMLFKVQDIRSRERVLYLDENFCDAPYQLDQSMVEVVNRLPYSHPSPPHKVKNLCKLEFNRKPAPTRRMCVVYIPNPKRISCGSTGWDLIISNSPRNFYNPSTHVYTLNCNHSDATEKHVYCAANTTTSLALFIHRKNSDMDSQSGEEPPFMFRLVVADTAGSPESLMEEVLRQQQAKAASGPGDSAPIYIIVLIVVAGVFLLCIILVVFMKIRNQYNKVPGGADKQDGPGDDDEYYDDDEP